MLIDLPINGNTYDFQLKASRPPFFINGTNEEVSFNLHLDLNIWNRDTGKVCPEFIQDDLPDRTYFGARDLELVIGDNLIN